jgi:predicted Rdx family selenoprotein
VAAAIKREFQVEAKLLAGHNGVFQVSVDGELVFNNEMKCGPMPKPEDIIPKIRELRGG